MSAKVRLRSSYGAHPFVEPLYLAGGGGRAGGGEPLGDPVLTTDPFEQHFTGPGSPPPGKHGAVVGEDFVGEAPASHRFPKRSGYCSGGFGDHYRGQDAEYRADPRPVQRHCRRLGALAIGWCAGPVLAVDALGAFRHGPSRPGDDRHLPDQSLLPLTNDRRAPYARKDYAG